MIRTSLLAALCAALVVPRAAAAQSQLDVAQAQPFLGHWVMPLETDFGPLSLELVIEDVMGKVGASVGSPDFGMEEVTDITKSGESLVMAYSVDAGGQMMDISLTLVPDGEDLAASLDVGGGQMAMSGTATRAES